MKRIKLLVTIQLLLLAFLLPAPTVGQRQAEITWSQPLLLGDGWWQSLTSDQEGKLHVSWYGSVANSEGIYGDALIYKALNPDGQWTDSKDVLYTGIGGYTIRNALAVTSDGMLHAVYRAKTLHDFSSAPARQADLANNWTRPIEVDDGGYYVDMMSDRSDVLHVVYSGGIGIQNQGGAYTTQAELSPCATCNDLFYRRSTDGGKSWTLPVPISLEPESGSDRMDIFQASSGRIYIIWDEGRDWAQGRGVAQDVRLVYSDDSGLTWSEPLIFAGDRRAESKPIQGAAAELLDGTIMVVWRYSSDGDPFIYYQTSSDRGITWSDPQPIPNIFARSNNETPLDDYELLVDRLGVLSLFAVGQPGAESRTNAALYQIVYVNQQWLPPVRVFYSPDQRPEWPKAAIGLRNELHLTFFTRGIREGAGGLQGNMDLSVFYSSLPGNYPARIVPFKATPTPQATPTLVQNLPATPTPFPKVERITNPQPITTPDRYATETVLGGLFAVGIGCLIVAVIYRIVSRR